MEIREDISLKEFNTFNIDVKARHFVELTSTEDIISFVRDPLKDYRQHLILGGGSNTLFTENYDGLVIHVVNKGIQIKEEDADHVILQVGAGEIWDDLVEFTVERGWGGLENLSLIPGLVGASPIQNIGAYGVELKDHFVELQAVELKSGNVTAFSSDDCAFGYRSSIFKNEFKGRYIILNITLKLDKKPVLRMEYGAIEQELVSIGVMAPSILDIRRAVCNIRSRKLPDPSILGNGGSFFKNPVVGFEHFEALKKDNPGIVAYDAGNNNYKLAAAWLIERSGWKGFRRGDAGVHQHQALVLVNYGNASGINIIELSKEIEDSVFEKFDVRLEREINVI
jgi:UDP-N-acetylmuramate dehydrogenase